MAGINVSTTRTTTMSTSNQLLASLRQTQRRLLELQKQIDTGRALDKPSDNTARTSAVLLLESQIGTRQLHEQNLKHGRGVLDTADHALGEGSAILIEATSIASSQIGIGSDAATRASEATVINAKLRAMFNIANQQFRGISLFGGNASAAANDPIFIDFLGGVRYLGSRTNQTVDIGAVSLEINANGEDAFSAFSTRVLSPVDLNPKTTSATKITDVNGAQGVPVNLATIQVNVDGNVATVDLAGSETLGDVMTRIQAGIDSLDNTAGTITIANLGFRLMATAGHAITLRDIGSGKTAANLGIGITSTGGVPVDGADIDPRLTFLTDITALDVSVDFASGLKVTQDAQTRVANFSTATTVEDLINVVDQLGLGLRLEVNDQQTGFNLFSDVSGLELSIGESNGGTTAQDLGLRTFGTQTLLADFRFELGVESVLGADDFSVELRDGRSFNVNLDGVATVGELITVIQAAAGAAGLSVGSPGATETDLNVGLALDGNGFLFEDGTTGPGDFRVVQLGTSLAATHLGIYTNAGAANQIQGTDLAKVRVESVFTHLINLRDSLLNNDSLGITLASEGLDADLQTLAIARADIGGRSQMAQQQLERTRQVKTVEIQLLSELQDTDLTQAITQFLQLQHQLEASLAVGAVNLQLSLIDFLR